MEYLHEAQLSNVVTAYATLLAGVVPVVLTFLVAGQPARWRFVYICVIITAIPTIWFHAVEDSNLAAACDVASNILLAWAVQVAVAGDFMRPAPRKIFLAISTVVNLGIFGWLIYELTLPAKVPVLQFGDFGQFYAGEAALILNAWCAVAIILRHRRAIPRAARPVLGLVVVLFLTGMFMATAANDQVNMGFLAWHATWHIVGAFGFMCMWIFNHLRFYDQHVETA